MKYYFFLFEDSHSLLELGDISLLVSDAGLQGVDPGGVVLLHGFEAVFQGIDPLGVIFLYGFESLCLRGFRIIMFDIAGGFGVFNLLTEFDPLFTQRFFPFSSLFEF